MRLFVKLAAVLVIGVIIHLALTYPEKRLRQAEHDARYVAPKLAAYINYRLSEQPLRGQFLRSTGPQQLQIVKDLTLEFERKRQAGTLPPLKQPWEYSSPTAPPTTQP